MEFGRRLKDERLRLGLSLADIEEETKIRKYYLEALENENFSVLPPSVYASGFVKRYALILGLDEQEMVKEFRELAYGKEQEVEVEEPVERVPIAAPRKPLPIKNIAAGLVFLVIVLWLGSYVASFIANRGKDKIAAPTQPQVQETQSGKPESQTVPPANQTPAQQSGVKIDIEAIARCWLNITVDGKIQYTGTLVAGDKRTFTGNKSVVVEAGNARGVKITFNGVEQPPMEGSSPQIREYKATQ